MSTEEEEKTTQKKKKTAKEKAIGVVQPKRVRCSHLLVKHQESRRPASWRDETGAIIGKKTKECAIDELLAYREQIEKNVVSFAELATKVSDCSSARHGGDLGTFERGAMQKAFEDAAFGLEVGEMSGMVDSDSGVHIILRVE
jgi:NIMA-interacting peptidyl-prolyl cis-trans isomerase 1